jgi:hypothetical protein
MEGHLEYRGNHVWPNEKAAVAGTSDLKISFIEVIYGFIKI